MTGNMFSQDRPAGPLRFLPCQQEDLAEILKASLELLDEFQKDQALDLSVLRELIIARAREELPEYTKLMAGTQLIGWYHLIESPKVLELDDVNILEPFRSLGYGSRLLDRVLEEGRIRSKPVTVTVAGDNPGAVRFYERHGFRFVKKDRQHHLCFIHDSHLDQMSRRSPLEDIISS